jgi:hypothetical protein
MRYADVDAGRNRVVVHDVSRCDVVKSEASENDVAPPSRLGWLGRRSLAETSTQSNARSTTLSVSAMSAPSEKSRSPKKRTVHPELPLRKATSARLVKSLKTRPEQMEEPPSESQQIESRPFA